MTEQFGSGIYLVLVLHAFMLCMALFCCWIGWRVRFAGDLSLVRDAKHIPLPNGALIARRYGNSYLAAGAAIILLAFGTALGLPFEAWMPLNIAIVVVQMVYRGALEDQGR